MAEELITARVSQVDENGNKVVDEEGKAVMLEGSAMYDFGGDLEGLLEKAKGNKEAIYSNAVANLKVTVQSLMRTAISAGASPEALQAKVTAFVPGVAMAKQVVDPIEAAKAAFGTWDPEKQRAFLEQLGTSLKPE
jgi:hypothetical protein